MQNSLDAILLREKVNSNSDFDKAIKIIFRKEDNPKTGVERRCIDVVDEGVGMDLFKIERYFTSIGRSYYVSEEFEELKKSKGIKFDPISNFGIGFLSAFMVCEEIRVTTKGLDDKHGLIIEVPNFDGCFFISKSKNATTKIGTIITLYEDGRRLLEPSTIINYIKNVMLDFQLDIEIHDQLSNRSEVLKAYTIRQNAVLPLFIPITDDGMIEISWKDEVQNKSFTDNYKFGYLVDFGKKKSAYETNVYLNSGIRLSGMQSKFIHHKSSNHYFNFPSAYLKLDVAREKILNIKGDVFSEESVLGLFLKQAYDLLDYASKEKQNFSLSTINNIYNFFMSDHSLNQKSLARLRTKLFSLSIVDSSSKRVSVTLNPSIDGPFPWVNFEVKALQRLVLGCYKLVLRELSKMDKEKFSQQFSKFSRKSDDYFSIFEDIDQDNSAFFQKNFLRLSKIYETSYVEEGNRYHGDIKLLDFSLQRKKFISKIESRNIWPPDSSARMYGHKNRLPTTIKKHSPFLNNNFSSLIKEFFPDIDMSFQYKEPQYKSYLNSDILSQKLKSNYKIYLFGLIVAPFYVDRDKSTFTLYDILIRVFYFYHAISQTITIEEAKNFELTF